MQTALARIGPATTYSPQPMATDKRARQRANREAKRAIELKQQRRQRTLRLARRIAIYAVIIVIVLVLANVVFGGGGTSTTTTTASGRSLQLLL